MSFSIKRKSAIVTGAANGVGLAIARHFVGQRANVMLADLNAEGLRNELTENQDNASCFVGDLRDSLTRSNLVAETINRFGRVDILVNASRQLLETTDDTRDSSVLGTMLDQNLSQQYSLSRLVAEKFREQANETPSSGESIGSIINISCIAARRGLPELLEYSISCAALEQLTRSLALAVARHKIRVNAVAFGSVMSGHLQSQLSRSPELRTSIQSATPLNWIADASDVAEAVQFLASEGSRFITGQVLTVDGGRTLQDRATVPCH